MICFLANENIPLASINILRQYGLSITAIIEQYRGISDQQVLQLAHKNKEIIITFDRDYGELIYKRNFLRPHGLIYLRFIPQYPEEPAEYLIKLLTLKNCTLENMFTVVERDKVRQRPL
jgi:predicted nuclease of predicted toxin-antitoxin system